MEPLLGVVFVAQLPSQQGEVYFQYTPNDIASCCATTPSAEAAEATPPLGLRFGDSSQQRPRVSSSEDLQAKTTEVFGIPSMIFAKLMLPELELCNRPFFLEMDAGHRETSHKHNPLLSHLHFVSFPCTVAEFRRPDDPVSGRSPDDPPAAERAVQVVSFNVVHVLDSRRTGRRDAHTSTLWEVSAHLSRALVAEEGRESYLSNQIKYLATAQQDGLDLDSVLGQSSLARLLRDMVHGVKERGYKTLWVNGCIFCQVCIFPKHEAPAPPTADHALALLCNREDLLQELPLDSADIVSYLISAVSPRISLGELMVRLALPLGTLQRVSQHLVYWKKARVVEVFQLDTRVIVVPGVDTTADSPAEERFQKWQKGPKRQFMPGPVLMFSEVIKAFSQGHTLEAVRAKLGQGVDFDKLVEWLVAEDLLLQLATFVRFLPSKADSRKPLPPIEAVNANVRRKFLHHHLTEDELRLLASRADYDDQRLLFLCRFVVEFARGRVRIDGCGFAALAAPFFHDRSQEGKKFIDANKDMFVKYVCRC